MRGCQDAPWSFEIRVGSSGRCLHCSVIRVCGKEPLLLFQQHREDGSDALGQPLPAQGHSGGFVQERLLAEPHRANGETIPKKAAPAPNSHIKPPLWPLPCQSLKLAKVLDPFVLISLQKVPSCPSTTQTQGTPQRQECWGLLGQECCRNSQHLPCFPEISPREKRVSLIQMTHYLQRSFIVL